MYPSLHKENPHSARDFKQKWKVLPHYATESLKYIYSNKIVYIYIHNIFSAEFQIKSNILEIKYKVPPKIDLRLIHSTSTSWKQSKHPTDSSGKSPRRQDWEWGVRSDQLCAAGGVICTHRNLLSHLFLSHFSNFSLLPRPFRTIGSSSMLTRALTSSGVSELGNFFSVLTGSLQCLCCRCHLLGCKVHLCL